MGLDFRIRDFAYPLSILKFKRAFDRNQWLSVDELEKYQFSRLKKILDHSCRHVPYYRDLFRQNNLLPADFKSLQDLKKLPTMTKKTIQKCTDRLQTDDIRKYHPRWVETSGTTGGQIKLCMDKTSNALEFTYYWRFWGWAGYRMGDLFAEMSAQHFTPYVENKGRFYEYQPMIRRIMVNSLLLSRDNAGEYVKFFRKFRPKFLKGLPSNLYVLALLVDGIQNHDVNFKAVFSQGENLPGYQRRLIEKVFGCKVYDFYGHMERAVTISECPAGSYHVNMDYGILEIEPVPDAEVAGGLEEDEYIGEVIGTGLYNFAMPLIRYKTGDWVKVRKNPNKCPCGRNFPTVVSILGRDSDIIITPDGRAITALYVAFDQTPGIRFGQIVQKSMDKLLVRIVPEGMDKKDTEARLSSCLSGFLGNGMSYEYEYLTVTDIKNGEKFKSVVSKIDLSGLISRRPPIDTENA